MGNVRATPGEIVKLLLSESDLEQAKTTALIKTDSFETIRLCVQAGREIESHRAKGPITVECLQGKVIFSVEGQDLEMVPGDWLWLEGGQLHSLRGIEDSTLVLTLIFPKETK